MAEQEDEEEKLKWRVDAEVKLAMEEFQSAQAQQGVGSQGAFHTHQLSCSSPFVPAWMHWGNALRCVNEGVAL